MDCPGFPVHHEQHALRAARGCSQFAIGDERERGFLPEHGSGGAASRGSGDGRRNAAPGEQLSERAADRGSSDRARGIGGRTFTMFHGTSWRSWQHIRQQGFQPSGSDSGLGEGVYLTRSEKKAGYYKTARGVVIKVRVKLGACLVGLQ